MQQRPGKVNWRVGEWRVRRNKKVAQPNADDYGRALQGRVQAAVQPLREEVRALRDEIKRLEGRLDGIRTDEIPQLEVGFLQKGEITSETSLTYVTPEQTSQRKFDELRPNFEKHLKGMHMDKRISENDNGSFQKVISPEEETSLKSAQSFLGKYGVEVTDEDIRFDKVWISNRYNYAHKQNMGPDRKRVEEVTPFLKSVENCKFHVGEAFRIGGFVSLDLFIQNRSKTPARTMHGTLEVENESSLNLYKYAPRARRGLIYSYSGKRADGSEWSTEFPLELLLDCVENRAMERVTNLILTIRWSPNG